MKNWDRSLQKPQEIQHWASLLYRQVCLQMGQLCFFHHPSQSSLLSFPNQPFQHWLDFQAKRQYLRLAVNTDKGGSATVIVNSRPRREDEESNCTKGSDIKCSCWFLSATAGSRKKRKYKTLCFDSLEKTQDCLECSGELSISIKLFFPGSSLGVL